MSIASFATRGVMIAGEGMILCRPAEPIPTSSLPAIIAIHGHGGDASQMAPYWRGMQVVRKLVETGYQVLCIDAGGGATFNNDTAMAAITAAYNWLANTNGMAGQKVGLLAWSMGGGNSLQWIKGNAAKVSAAFLFAPLTDLDYYCAPGGVPTAEAQAAYGGNYAVNSQGHKIANEYPTWRDKCPIKIASGTADTTVPLAKPQAFVAGVNQPQVTIDAVNGADHTSVLWLYGDEKIVSFFETQGADIGGPVVPATTPTFWLDADGTKFQDTARTIPAVNDNDPIASWTDSAGTAHAAQATTTKRPLLKKAVLNGHDVVRFDGVDDWLEAAIAPLVGSTLFAVIKTASLPATSRSVLAWKQSSTQRVSLYYASTGTPSGYGFFANQAVAAVQIGGTPTNWNILCFQQVDAATCRVWLNGGASMVTFDPADVLQAAVLFNVGANNGSGNADADVAGVRRYSSVLTTDQIDTVGNELAAKYGLAWNPAV